MGVPDKVPKRGTAVFERSDHGKKPFFFCFYPQIAENARKIGLLGLTGGGDGGTLFA
jgi:hypothetical protein